VVIDPAFTWGDDRPPRTPWHQTIVYELHVKGFTQLHPEVPDRLRGTYLGLASEGALRHLTSLGITAVELLPVHHFLKDRLLLDRGLTNYWGYNTLAYFAPESRYGAQDVPQDAVQQFKMMVAALHAAGIEVILDVVYNHTAEGNQLGPTLSLRGIDNVAYYKLSPDDPRYYMDYTGTGNSLNVRHPRVLQLITDSLRYWVTEMHIDGFRFDLASTLARELYEVDRLGAFFDIIHQDPILSQVKLIAEPWDVGPGGYQVGNFPVLWSEWNGKYRDTVRRFWKGDDNTLSEFATRLSGSSDLYQNDGRKPYASINFITCHDGFPLHDLVSYNEKHNDANGENNQDGHGHNLSWNFGVEGPTDDPAIVAERSRQKRNLLATVFFSQGVPMLLMGDEMSRTQRGNNNAYAQDNEINWFDWEASAASDPDLLSFTQALIAIRRRHDAFRRRAYLTGATVAPHGLKDVYWLAPEGREMTNDDWGDGQRRTLGMQLGNDAADAQRFLLLLSSAPEPIEFKLPPDFPDGSWVQVFDTALSTGLVRKDPLILQKGESVALAARSLMLFQHGHRAEAR
jgi:isoamylase